MITIIICLFNLLNLLYFLAFTLSSETCLAFICSEPLHGYFVNLEYFYLEVYGADISADSCIVYIKGENIDITSIKQENLGTPPLGPQNNGGPGNAPIVAPVAVNNNHWLIRLSAHLQGQQALLNRPNLILNDLHIRFTSDPTVVNVNEFPHSSIHRMRVEHPGFFELFPGHTKVDALIRDINSLIE